MWVPELSETRQLDKINGEEHFQKAPILVSSHKNCNISQFLAGGQMHECETLDKSNPV